MSVYYLCECSILKVGVACMDDARYLLKDYQLDCVGCVDLRNLVPRTMPSATAYVDYCIIILNPVKRHTFVAALFTG